MDYEWILPIGDISLDQEEKLLAPIFELYDGGGLIHSPTLYEINVRLLNDKNNYVVVSDSEIIERIKNKVKGKIFASTGLVLTLKNSVSIQRFGLTNRDDFSEFTKALKSIEGVLWVNRGEGPWENEQKRKSRIDKITALSNRSQEIIKKECDKFLSAAHELDKYLKKYCQLYWDELFDLNPDWTQALSFIEAMGKCRIVIIGDLFKKNQNNSFKFLADATDLTDGKALKVYLQNLLTKESFDLLTLDELSEGLILNGHAKYEGQPKFIALSMYIEGPENFIATINFAIKEL
jgi:hypothetical protein